MDVGLDIHEAHFERYERVPRVCFYEFIAKAIDTSCF